MLMSYAHGLRMRVLRDANRTGQGDLCKTFMISDIMCAGSREHISHTKSVDKLWQDGKLDVRKNDVRATKKVPQKKKQICAHIGCHRVNVSAKRGTMRSAWTVNTTTHERHRQRIYTPARQSVSQWVRQSASELKVNRIDWRVSDVVASHIYFFTCINCVCIGNDGFDASAYIHTRSTQTYAQVFRTFAATVGAIVVSCSGSRVYRTQEKKWAQVKCVALQAWAVCIGNNNVNNNAITTTKWNWRLTRMGISLVVAENPRV